MKQEFIDFVMQYIVLRKMLGYIVQTFDRNIYVYGKHMRVMSVCQGVQYPEKYVIKFKVSCTDTYLFEGFKKFADQIDEIQKLGGDELRIYTLTCEDEEEWRSIFSQFK